MNFELLLAISLAVAATALVIIVSIGLVIHKAWQEKRRERKRGLYSVYSQQVAEIILQEPTELPDESRTSAVFDQYEQLLVPLKEGLGKISGNKKMLHREALKMALIDFAKDVTGETSERLTYFFYSLGYVEEEIRLLRDSRWWVRAQAAHDLRYLRARKAITPLTQCLEDHHAEVRIQAIQSLVVLGGVQSLATILRLSKNISHWTAIELSIIVMSFKEEAVPFLVDSLGLPDQSIVLFCIEMLAEIGFVSAVDSLRGMAKDYPNIMIRAKAVEALGRLGDARAESLLTELLKNPLPSLRLKAIEAIGRIGAPSAIPYLAQRMREGPLQEKILAARSIARSGSEGKSYLETLESDENMMVRDVSGQVLEEFEVKAAAT